jgi:hypothetical protein
MLKCNSFFKTSIQVIKSTTFIQHNKYFFKTMSNGHNHNNGTVNNPKNEADNLNNIMIEKGNSLVLNK